MSMRFAAGGCRTLAVGPLLLSLVACVATEAPTAGVVTAAVVEKPRQELPAPGIPAVPKRTVPEAVDEAFYAQLRRGPCYGRCPQYTVRIGAGGAVTFKGERFVAAIGEQQGQADASALADLLALLRQPEMAALKDIYRPGQAGCGRATTDMPNSDLEWQIDGHRHQLRLYQGCSKLPPQLLRVPSAIDAAAGSRHWVEDGADR